MTISKSSSVGILHPGAMGISIAATMKNSGHLVYWASQGRSPDSQARANEHSLLDAQTVAALAERCEVLVSVCPPHAAETLAENVIETGFSGYYLDANAIAPQKVIRIGEKMTAAGITFVDGGIIGGPAWQAGRTWLYLSGESAATVNNIFAAGPLETEIINNEIGKASALKMVFAANTKGTTALLAAVMATAEKLGVRENLERQWSRYNDAEPEQSQNRVRNVTAKAWRFAGEMEEIAATFSGAGLPDGFHLAAHELYQRIAHFKNADDTPELMAVLTALMGESD
jgi:3-hydroxyisobutyrate dehydrogenase-like beta-hydroxyacid dehydrogenase